MAATPGNRLLSREQRRALKILADVPRGVAGEVLVVAHGFSPAILDGLIRSALATVATDTRTGPRGVAITAERIRITDDGRKALED